METVELKAPPQTGFRQNKTVKGVYCGRKVIYRRGRKFVIWEPWTVEAMADVETYYDAEILDALERAVYQEIMATPNPAETFLALQNAEVTEENLEQARKMLAEINFT